MQPAVTSITRQQALERLRSETFDVLILGGGINGAGTARDLALRACVAQVPLRIGLIEQNHFGSGTSSKNSHLIHGGLRYLRQLAFGLVRESLHERAVLLRIAPHLVEPQLFLMPLAGLAREIYYNLGLTLDKMGKHEDAIASFKKVVELAPSNSPLRDSVILKEHIGK